MAGAPSTDTFTTSPAELRDDDARHGTVRFGVVLVLLLTTFIVLAVAPSGPWVIVLTTALQATTLLAVLRAARSGRRLFRLAVVVSVAGVAGAVVAAIAGHDGQRDALLFVDVLLVGAAPVAILAGIVRRRTLDIQTVLGALCVYVLLGMCWAFLFAGINAIGSDPFFAQQSSASMSDFQYFSFVTLTTTGYGDLAAAGGLGRALSVIEALLGQLYLVTVVALLVSNLGTRRLS